MKKILILSALIFTLLNNQATIIRAQNLPTVPTINQQLDQEIQKIINAGHLRPSFTYGVYVKYSSNIYVPPTPLPNIDVQEFDEVFHNPADTLYTLSIAYPYVNISLQNQLRLYLESEFNTYQPYRYDYMGTSGNHREFNDVPPEVTISHPAYYMHGSSPSTLTGFAGWNFNPFNYYALYTYAKIVGNAPTILNLLSQYNHASPQPLPSDSFLKDRPHVLNSYIAGYYGYLGLCANQGTSCPNTTVNNIQTYLNAALSKRVQFLPASEQEVLSLSTYEAGGFLYLVPELGDYLFNNAKAKVAISVNSYEKGSPYWMIPQVEEATRLKSTTRLVEGNLSQMYDESSAFLAKAYALKLSSSELEQYLHGPGYEKGDLFYIQNLVAALSAENTSLPTSTSPPYSSPTSIPTATPLPGDINNDNIVNILDYTLLSNAFGTNNSAADINNDGTVNILDYAILSNNFGKST